MMERDEVYLVDMWRILLREWRWWLTVLVLALALTFAFTHLAKRQWEATAWIQIGQVGAVPGGQDPKVEPLARVLERLQTAAFQNEVMQSLGFTPESRESHIYRKSLKLEPLPYAGPLVKLTVRGSSPPQARQFAEATVARLHAIHQGLEAKPLALAQARLNEVQSELSGAVTEREQWLQTAGRNDAASKAGQGMALTGVLAANMRSEIYGLTAARSDLSTRLSTTYTYETSLLWPVYVPEHQAFPNPVLCWGVGILGGLCLGVFAAMVRNAMRRRNSRK
ncbi:Chain length determinant protein [Dyella sp. OK004]|uniref:Wzz/FepE/Etk N-terminal domain-containing protein n=1 Tax=Dyella sp. OK004 TaxID=1855292 RepID=UPI0008EE4D68|nr:Wzz/FepE/Etk N-terminal domain-containing protein [Dyella sp. OK004]SFS19941.1 Chain length determinant protein [Dyella sp. OK004]